jgi:heme/copper-type cytochrome/quinol oxidase subunit 4
MSETQQQVAHGESEEKTQRRGLIVIGILAVLTLIEYIIAVAMDGGNVLAALLGVVALIKGVVILQYFMHFHQLWDAIMEVWDNVVYEPDPLDEEGGTVD